MADKVIIRKPHEGDAYWAMGGLYEIKAAAEETGGTMTVVQVTLPAGMGPPPHIHTGGEAVFVLEGTLRFHIEDDVVEGGPGSFFYLPAGTWENYEPTSTVRALLFYAPGGIDEFFAEVGKPALYREVPPSREPLPELDVVEEAYRCHGMRTRPPT